MKRTILFLVFAFFFAGSNYAQQFDEAEVKADVIQYFSYNESANWDGLLDMLVPEFVEMMGRDMIKTQMEQLMKNPTFAISFGGLEIKEVYDNFSVKSDSFAFVGHKFNMNFAFKQMEDQTKEEFDGFFDLMTETFKTQYPGEGFNADKEKKVITVVPDKIILAVKKPDYDTWKFIDFESQNLLMYEALFGEEVAAILKSKTETSEKDD